MKVHYTDRDARGLTALTEFAAANFGGLGPGRASVLCAIYMNGQTYGAKLVELYPAVPKASIYSAIKRLTAYGYLTMSVAPNESDSGQGPPANYVECTELGRKTAKEWLRELGEVLGRVSKLMEAVR